MSSYRHEVSCRHVCYDNDVIKVFKKILQRQIFNCKKIVDGKMFNCKMTEEPTMATAEEAAQRVYTKKLAADRESKKRKRAEE